MTPGARVAAAIAVLDRVGQGTAAEQALTAWARSARYAGSKDRAVVRDHVFSVLRRWRSCAQAGGGETGRALMQGLLRTEGIAPDSFFTGEGHAPAPLSPQEQAGDTVPEGDAMLDLPDWLLARFRQDHGAAVGADLARCLRDRAPLHLRVNLRKAGREDMIAALAEEGIAAGPVSLSPTALEVTEGVRRVRLSEAYRDGRVEIQDAASQAVCDLVALEPGARVLDYCAGGGGKSLALAARADLRLFAHDANPQRMKDLPARAARAGVEIATVGTQDLAALAPFDLVVADVPCSGSGAWRRQPEAKWRLTPERLGELVAIQAAILGACAALLRPGGRLVYMTCSLLRAENDDQVQSLLRSDDRLRLEHSRAFSPLEGGDGLFMASFSRIG